MNNNEAKKLKIGVSVIILVLCEFVLSRLLGILDFFVLQKFLPEVTSSGVYGGTMMILGVVVSTVVATCYIKLVEKETSQIMLIAVLSIMLEACVGFVCGPVLRFFSLLGIYEILSIISMVLRIVVDAIWAAIIISIHRKQEEQSPEQIKKVRTVLLVLIFISTMWVCIAEFNLRTMATIIVCALMTGIVATLFNIEDHKQNKKEVRLSIIGIVVMSIILSVLCVSCEEEPSSSGKWDSLSDEEKDWYERNYGNGKSDAYDKAIDDYKNR